MLQTPGPKIPEGNSCQSGADLGNGAYVATWS
jgi:hypothetical protein